MFNIANTIPEQIYFIYGPINSGKTTLMYEFINRLEKINMLFFTYLLEDFFIRSYSDFFLNVLFHVKKFSIKNFFKFLPDITLNLRVCSYIPKISISEMYFNLVFKESSSSKIKDDVFSYIERLFLKIKSQGKQPILILDELQVLKYININGPLIYKLFNSLVHLTKETHLCHVFAITSNSLFINELRGMCDYILVDDLNRKVVEKVLKEHNFSEEEISLVWHYFGGKYLYVR